MKVAKFSAVAAAATLSTLIAHAASPSLTEVVRIGGTGSVAIVNTCNADSAPLKGAADKFGNILMVPFTVQDGSWSLQNAEKSLADSKANVAVFVVDDGALPLSLVSIEAKWGVVNARSLDASQLEKEVMRVAAIVLGGATSQYSASVMRPVFSREDLNTKAGSIVAFDSLMAISHNLPDLGIVPYKMMTRGDAIEEGLITK